MAGSRLRTALNAAVVLNLLLMGIGTVIRSTLQPSQVSSYSRLSEDGQDIAQKEFGKKTEPYIVPKLSDGSPPQVEAVNGSVVFIRTKWGEMFLPDNKSLLEAWKNKVPKNFSQKPDFVLGVPTIARRGGSYLFETLRSLFRNVVNYRDFVIVVYVGEQDEDIARRMTKDIRGNFSKEYEAGILQIITPPENIYPDWKTALRQSFDDNFERVKWRSKQVLDQIFLMMYSYHLQSKYYLMLKDDIVAANNYLAKIFLDAESKKEVNFVLISYCQLGAIGKLFRRELVPSIAAHLSLFWSDKPLDWLLIDYMQTRVCDIGKDTKHCKDKLKEVEIVYKPSLFQHVGTTSSFPGKIQKLKDRAFKPR